MESLQLIKNRINSISSTRQITQSMRLVSTSKVQKARARMEANRPFLEETRGLIRIAAQGTAGNRHPYLWEREPRQAAVIAIAGDRGLCGGYNINANREAARLIKQAGDVKIVSVGLKARDYCRRRYKQRLVKSYQGISETPFFDDAREIADLVLDWYRRGEVDRVYLVYTRFESMLSQVPLTERLLPLETGADSRPEGPRSLVRCEPEGDDFLSQVVPFYLAAHIYGAILESAACEQSARITSMDAAVKNSDEMIESLTLRYNQARQSAITQELTEIVAGAGAVMR